MPDQLKPGPLLPRVPKEFDRFERRKQLTGELVAYPGEVNRSVSFRLVDGKPAAVVRISCSLDTTIEELWDALTSRRRVSRWFLPVTGRLQLGGRFQLEGNASGVITVCEYQSGLAFTWEFSGDVSWVRIKLVADGTTSRMELSHKALVTDHWNIYGPGATGVGWELGLLGLATHLRQPNLPAPDAEDFATSKCGRALIEAASRGWKRAAVAAGTDPKLARVAARRTTAFYTGQSNGTE